VKNSIKLAVTSLVTAAAVIPLSICLGIVVSPPCGRSNTLPNALSQRDVKVVFWGDSITEGTSQVEYSNSWPGLTEVYLRDRIPDIRWSFANLSVSGLNMYAALEGPAHNQSRGLWRDEVKSEKPDLLFIAFGMNAPEGNPYGVGLALQQLIDHIKRWEKVPTIVVVTPMMPTVNPEAPSSPFEWVDAAANEIRYVAQQNRVLIADAATNSHHLRYIGKPEIEILGSPSDDDDGNGFNHPTKAGHNALYFQPVSKILEQLIAPSAAP
jgi:lysophospholipase L1-like esterase